jgi:hypothetical protein
MPAGQFQPFGRSEFDPASFVLTVMGRIKGGTAHGDRVVADRFANRSRIVL